MASQSLYRKWRSQTFSDLVGQEEIVQTLKNALIGGTQAHAYLFTGPRGTGKTSTARLLAKTINCQHPHNGEPCNECQQCREIAAGNSLNVIEIDAASNRGIDSIRELRDKVMMPPITGKYKVYILDEAHMLTPEAFNALLKTLEEPPKHAIFVLATTDVHKMLPTVISRCQQFNFKRITTRSIVKHLNFVATQERIQLEASAAELIARAAAGGMRDALSLLDQAIAYCGHVISLQQVQAMLGVADPRAIQKFILHVAHLDSAAGLHLIHELAETGADLRQINNQVAEYWRGVMLAKAGADIATILDRTDDEVRETLQVVPLFSLEELTECARIFAQNELLQKSQGTPQLGLELALLACIEVHRRSQADTSAIHATSSTQPVQLHTTPIPAKPTAQPAVSPTQPEPYRAAEKPVPVQQITPPPPVAVVLPTSTQVEPSVQLPDWDDMPGGEDEYEEELAVAPSAEATRTAQSLSVGQSGETAPMVASSTQQEPPSGVRALTIQQVKEKWESIKRRVRTQKDGAMIAAVLNDYILVAIEGTQELPVVVVKTDSKFHYNTMQKPERHKAVEWALKIELEQECRLKILPLGYDIRAYAPASPSPIAGSQSAYAAMPTPSTQPARLERPSPGIRHEQPPAANAQRPITSGATESPLARIQSVRENTTKATHSVQTNEPAETRQQMIERKAKSDPVVQEAVRIFKAQIKEVRPK
jgi:DNA polymerase-3 subunit gamma/tau